MTEIHPLTGMETERWAHPSLLIVATDLTDLDLLMPFAFDQAAQSGARLILLHVLASGTGLAVDESGMPSYDPASALEYAARTMEPWCAAVHKQSIGCDALVREGHAARQIVSAARQFHADRILLGARGRNRLSQLLLGSVTEQVLRSVQLPVMTVGPEARLAEGASEQEKVVLYATLLREASRPSAALAGQLAADQGVKLVLLHVLPPEDRTMHKTPLSGLDSVVLHELSQLAAETVAREAEPVVAHGNPVIEILAASVALHASLIVLSAAEHTGLDRLTRDRTVCRVLAHARCPVLTLHEPLAQPVATGAKPLALHK